LMRTSKTKKQQLGVYDFACIRYPPPLLQRRSCETDLQLNQRSIICQLCFQF
jgi:hypothetical protein